MKLLVATHNPGKAGEFQALLATLEARLCFPPEMDLQIDVPEDGDTFADNARQKAQAYARASNLAPPAFTLPATLRGRMRIE